MAFCKDCEHQIEEIVNFCDNCGHQLKRNNNADPNYIYKHLSSSDKIIETVTYTKINYLRRIIAYIFLSIYLYFFYRYGGFGSGGSIVAGVLFWVSAILLKKHIDKIISNFFTKFPKKLLVVVFFIVLYLFVGNQ